MQVFRLLHVETMQIYLKYILGKIRALITMQKPSLTFDLLVSICHSSHTNTVFILLCYSLTYIHTFWGHLSNLMLSDPPVSLIFVWYPHSFFQSFGLICTPMYNDLVLAPICLICSLFFSSLLVAQCQSIFEPSCLTVWMVRIYCL